MRTLLKSFMATCEKVEMDSGFKKALALEKDEHAFKNEYLQPLKELKNIVEKLESETDIHSRGKAWALLGYLQVFLFGNMGYIDPKQKVALKLRYVEEEIMDCENTEIVANLYSRIFGLTDDSILHPRLAIMKENLNELRKKQENLKVSKAIRPINTEFIALSKKFLSFRSDIGSYSKMNKNVQQLIETALELEKEVSIYFFKNLFKSLKNEYLS